MHSNNKWVFRSILFAAACLCAPAMAAVYNTAVGASNFTGTRTTDSASANYGLGYAAYSGTGFSATISWSITPISGGFHYEYTFDTPTGTGQNWNALSHFVLDLSDDCTSTSPCFQNLMISYDGEDPVSASGAFGTYDSSNGNPQMPGSIIGVKFAQGDLPVMFEFDSNRIPVWGDFYAKQGNPAATGNPNGFGVWNLGLGNHGSTDIFDFIARPDTVVVEECEEPGGCGPSEIPLPGTLALLGLGLFGVVGARRVVGSRTT